MLREATRSSIQIAGSSSVDLRSTRVPSASVPPCAPSQRAASEAAQSVALAIKTSYPIVQVSVYDSVEHTHTMVEVPTASS